jgi:predicted ATP-dependent endonuclease of OLD family
MRIKEIKVQGFRSLWDTRISGFGPVNVFYGDNDSGKSNILAAIDLLFNVAKPETLDSPLVGFYRSTLNDFTDNYTQYSPTRKADKIVVETLIELENSDLRHITTFKELIETKGLVRNGHTIKIGLKYEITPAGWRSSNRVLKLATVNNTPFYDDTIPLPGKYFQTLVKTGVSISTTQNAAENLFLYLVNCFGLVHTERHLQEEISEDEQDKHMMSTERLKTWLKTLAESRGEKYELFEAIKKALMEKPFDYGEIRPVREDGKTEVLITDMTRELLIQRHGTGIQQILFILSRFERFRFERKESKIVGVEELELNLSPSLQNAAFNYIKTKIGNGPSDYCSQIFITSHSMHLGVRADAVLFATTPPNDTSGTGVLKGPQAIAKLNEHFNYGLVKLPRNPRWRT